MVEFEIINMAQIQNTTQNTDERTLTPEILTAAGWKKEEESPISVSYSIDLDEDFGKDETDFSAFMMVVFRKFPNINERHILFDIERTFGIMVNYQPTSKCTIKMEIKKMLLLTILLLLMQVYTNLFTTRERHYPHK